ncbi:MAG TPA: hypothetical protein VL992_00950 [Tepidisphaeraceae bacterium]|nr:hypothetical protein [Tepidisphaeraceae bacterium]
MAAYLAQYNGTYPTAFLYVSPPGSPTTNSVNGGPYQLGVPTYGYLQWSAMICGKTGALNAGPDGISAGSNPLYGSNKGWDAFTCPDCNNGGDPPTDTYSANWDSGITGNDAANSVWDYQAPRCAYTLNEAICGWNVFYPGYQGYYRSYQFVRAGKVTHSAQTILATEFNQDWHVLAGGGRINSSAYVCKSQRPVHAYTPISGTPDDGSNTNPLNMPACQPDFRGRPVIERVNATILVKNPSYPYGFPGAFPGGGSLSRLDWVGRNHGWSAPHLDTQGRDLRTTNFLYCDGHVETKSIYETIPPDGNHSAPWEWGDQFFSLVPNGDVMNQ